MLIGKVLNSINNICLVNFSVCVPYEKRSYGRMIFILVYIEYWLLASCHQTFSTDLLYHLILVVALDFLCTIKPQIILAMSTKNVHGIIILFFCMPRVAVRLHATVSILLYDLWPFEKLISIQVWYESYAPCTHLGQRQYQQRQNHNYILS